MFPVNLCSTCLKSGESELVDINQLDLDNISYLTKLKACLCCTFMYENIAMEMCWECIKRLKAAYEFRSSVLISQEIIRKEFLENKPNQQQRQPAKPSDTYDDDSKDCCLDKLEVKLEDASKPETETKPKQKHPRNSPRKFVCTYCNRSFKQSFHLREHLTKHTGERKYTCTVCDKTFQRLSSQKRHLRTHQAAPGQKTKRTPFLCMVCGKSFPFSNGVQRHMRIHTGVRNHECKLCGRKFSQSTHLHVHMRTHTGEKPYVCDLCGEAFSFNASLQKHMAGHKDVVKEDGFLGMFVVEGGGRELKC